MEYVGVMKGLESFDDLYKDAPDILFAQVSLLFLMSRDLLEQIAIVGVFHDDAAKK